MLIGSEWEFMMFVYNSLFGCLLMSTSLLVMILGNIDKVKQGMFEVYVYNYLSMYGR